MRAGRRIFIGLLAAAALLMVGTSPAQAKTMRFEATFDESSCLPVITPFCGTGFVAQFGRASLDAPEPFPDPFCTSLGLRRRATIVVSGGTLSVCQIGFFLPPNGARTFLSGPFTVMSGTGVFAGASGGGNHTCEVITLGSRFIARCQYSGTLTLP